MKKLFVLLTLIVLNVQCYSQQNDRITSANLNLRAEPNKISQILTIIPKGTTVFLAEDCDCKWIKVSYKNEIGYVSSKYLKNYYVSNTKIPNSQSNYSLKRNNKTYTKDYSSHQNKYYTNKFGERIQSPTRYNKAPSGATALCRDGTYSFSRNRRGTCSHHGGVSKWLR